jgi:hypothetical protein
VGWVRSVMFSNMPLTLCLKVKLKLKTLLPWIILYGLEPQ